MRHINYYTHILYIVDMRKIRIHILGLPHTRLTGDYSHCAFTQKAKKLAKMLHGAGHTVYLYGSGDGNYSDICSEYVPIFTEHEFNQWFPSRENLDWNNPERWALFNERCAVQVTARQQPGDIVASTFGNLQQPACMATQCIPVETGIGYTGVFAPFQVYESYAIRTYLLGVLNLMHTPRHHDAVIPNYYDLSEFEFNDKPDDYFVFMGRLNEDKGFQTACRVAKLMGTKIKLAGPIGAKEVFSECLSYGNVEYLGVINSDQRKEVLSNARAVFVPTIYLEPFGGIHIEALLSGTPVITSDIGVFPETVQNGFNGFRCTNLAEFVEAARHIDKIDRKTCYEWAASNFSLDAILPKYEYYLNKVRSIWEGATYDSLDVYARADAPIAYFEKVNLYGN
jgi:glycosyltransferase involved in cell wall biosynthesis